MKEDYIIRLEKENDYYEVENVIREAFWNVYRPGCDEHFIVHKYRKRDDFVKELSFVLEKDNQIIGYIMYVRTHIENDKGKVPVMLFGPVGILPKYQHNGYGSLLIEHSLLKAKEIGEKAIVITGNIDFYSRFGFVTGKSKGVFYKEDRDAEYFLVNELEEHFFDSITGTFRDPEGYFVEACEVEEFDKNFCIKKKEKLAGQLV